MNVAVFGLGYVGCVTAACLAREGHRIIGVDVKTEKVLEINNGHSPIIEPGLDRLISSGVRHGRIEATSDSSYAVNEAELLMICVGTPSKRNGDLDLSYVEKVCGDIGRALKNKDSYTEVVIRSTMLPGSLDNHLIPILESASGKIVGQSFGLCVNPEFLREGSAIADFEAPPFTIIGQYDEESGKLLIQAYQSVEAPLYLVPFGVAEMVKYASNAFHALKVVFANEIGNLCQSYDIDSHQVMDIFVQDRGLNLSPAYLQPGFAFGGSCLPKDLRALLYGARRADVQTPVLESILPSNQLQIQKALDMLLDKGIRKVGVIGLSFKANTDDLRESPAIELVERLIGKGFHLNIYDREVSLSKLHGSNRDHIEKVIPHIDSLMRSSVTDTISDTEAIVIAKRPTSDEYDQLLECVRPEHILLDLVHLKGSVTTVFESQYYGISW